MLVTSAYGAKRTDVRLMSAMREKWNLVVASSDHEAMPKR